MPGKKKKSAGAKKPAPKKTEQFNVDISNIYRKRGRPPKYERPGELAEAIQSYLNSCWRPKFNMYGVPVKDPETGKLVFEQYKPYTITGMAAAIGMTRQTMLEYGKDERFAELIARAKQFIEQSTEEVLLTGKASSGAAFSLKNNFGWRDASEVKSDATVQIREEDRLLMQKVQGLLGEETEQ